MTLTSPTLMRTLVPANHTSAVPAGYTLVDDDLSGGLPAVLPLTPRLSVALVLSTGQVRPWLDADPGSLVSEHPAVESGSDPGEGTGLADASAPALRLVLLADRRVAGSMPLRPGTARLLPGDGTAPAQVGLLALAWRITAGCLVGPGATGCRLRIAWRAVTPAPAAVSPDNLQEW